MEKEEYALVIDYLPNGYPLEGKMMPIVQAIGMKNFSLLQLVPRKGVQIIINEKVYIGDGKRDQIYYILGRLPKEKITETAKQQIMNFAETVVNENEGRFVEFFNKVDAMNTRLHKLELLPGFGKKHTHEFLDERNKKAFESFGEMKKRIPSLPDPKKAVEKRIYEELVEEQRHYLFVP